MDLKVLEIAADVKSIIMASEIKIGNWTGKPGSKPKLGPDEINFNAMQPEDLREFPIPASVRAEPDRIGNRRGVQLLQDHTGSRTTQWCAPRSLRSSTTSGNT